MQINHEAQLSILKQLLYTPRARFSQLNLLGLDNNHFTWHLKHLVEVGLIDKINQHYQLTPLGLEAASRLDLKSLTIIKPPKAGVLLCITRKHQNHIQVLLGTRLRDPGKKQTGFFAAKINFGQSIFEAASQGLRRETGLSAKFTYAGTVRILGSDSHLPQVDRLMIYLRATNPSGHLTPRSPESQNFWHPYSQAYNLPHIFPDFRQDLDLFKRKPYFFEERLLNL